MFRARVGLGLGWCRARVRFRATLRTRFRARARVRFRIRARVWFRGRVGASVSGCQLGYFCAEKH